MSLVEAKFGMTAEEFATIPDGVGYELIEGDLKDRNVSVLANWVNGRLFKSLVNHVDENNLGWVFGPENGFRCFAHLPRTVRKPDVSFVRGDRLDFAAMNQAWVRLAPDLIAEVISPNDLWEEVNQKVEMFRKAGVPLIWVIGPSTRTVHITRADGTTGLLQEGDELSGEAVVPDFRCQVTDLFPPRPATPTTEPAATN